MHLIEFVEACCLLPIIFILDLSAFLILIFKDACYKSLVLLVAEILEVFKSITFSNAVWLQNCCEKFDVTLLFELFSLMKYKFSNTNKSYDQ